MALNATQRFQLGHLPIGDSSLTEGDRWAIAYIFQALSTPTNLTDAQRWQVAHLQIADSSFTIGDRFATAHLIQSLDVGTEVTDLWNFAWIVDPTWLSIESPQANDGSLLAGLAGFTVGLLGVFGDPVPEVDKGTPITNSQAAAFRSNFEICARTGFRQLPTWHPDSKFMRDGYGEYVRTKSADERHPQDFVKSRGGDKQIGSVSPEPDNVFISTSIAPEDL